MTTPWVLPMRRASSLSCWRLSTSTAATTSVRPITGKEWRTPFTFRIRAATSPWALTLVLMRMKAFKS